MKFNDVATLFPFRLNTAIKCTKKHNYELFSRNNEMVLVERMTSLKGVLPVNGVLLLIPEQHVQIQYSRAGKPRNVTKETNIGLYA